MRFKRSFGASEEVGSSTKEVAHTSRGRPPRKRFHVSDFPLKPRGEEGGAKRTPLHIGDPYAHEESYEVSEVLAQCLQRGVELFKVTLLMPPVLLKIEMFFLV